MTAISDFSGTPKETSLRICLPPSTVDRQVPGGEGDFTGVDELFEPVPDQAERRVADADDVVRAEQRRAALGDRLAVDVRAVVRAQVADLVAAVGRRVELGVVARDLEVGDHQLVLQRTADAHHAAQRELVERGRAAVAVDRRRPRADTGSRLLRNLRGGRRLVALLLRRLLRRRLLRPAGARALCGVRLLLRLGLRARHGGRGAGQAQPRAVGRVAQIHGRARADLHLMDALALHERAVGAAVVVDHPTPAAPADRGVPPGDPGVVDHDIPLRITSEGVGPGRVERPGPSIQFQYEFRHSMPH
jgi:hypothetical protein